MKFEIGKTYHLWINFNNNYLTFKAKILDEDENSITFTDSHNEKFSYKKEVIISAHEMRQENDEN